MALDARQKHQLLSEFMLFLAQSNSCDERIPPLAELSQKLGISVASLREQLEVARALGLVEVRPRTGIRRLPYTFRPAVLQSLAYSVETAPDTFRAFSDFRTHIETSYWYEAVSLLKPEDHQTLRDLVHSAKAKLDGRPPQIPHSEHRSLHLMIFSRLNNPFVIGVLEAYWTLYEAVGLAVYVDLEYQQRVWAYHERMVEAIRRGNFEEGHKALHEHMNLIFQRARNYPRQAFE